MSSNNLVGRAEARYSARDGGGGWVFGGKNKFSQRNKDDTLFMHLYEDFFLDHLHSVAGLARISVEHTQPVSSSSVIVILQMFYIAMELHLL